MKCFTLTLLSVALAGCMAEATTIWTQIRSYSGDGVIRDTSIFLSPGYRISFPKFDSARAYEAAYRLTNVPQLRSRPAAIIYLRFEPTDGVVSARGKKNAVTAAFRLDILNGAGKIVHSAEFHLADSKWTDGYPSVGVYELVKSEFAFKRNQNYTLRVQYIPGEAPPPARSVFFTIENGGHI